MAYMKKIKNPDTDQWLDVFSGRDQIARYFHIFNADKQNPVNIALAIYDSDLTELNHPVNATITQTGATGTTKYEYFITSKSSRGETDPLIMDPIINGYETLDDTTNYHTIDWDPILNEEITGYSVYVRVNDLEWYMKETDSETSNIINDGSWEFAYSPPWLNMTSVLCLLTFEQIPANSILEFSTDIEISVIEKIVFATTNSMVNLYARAIDVTS